MPDILKPKWCPTGTVPPARPSISWHVILWSHVEFVTECEDFVMMLLLEGRIRFAMNILGERLP